jgi:hypothetical protein
VPNQSHSAIVGVPWYRCQRCGCDVRVYDLVRQNGLLVCKVYGCADNRMIERRSRVIMEELKPQGNQEMQPAMILRVDFVDDTIDQI